MRATAVGLCTGSIGVALGTPWALPNLGLSTTLYIATGIALVGAVVSYFMAPETKDKDLSETAAPDTVSRR